MFGVGSWKGHRLKEKVLHSKIPSSSGNLSTYENWNSKGFMRSNKVNLQYVL